MNNDDKIREIINTDDIPEKLSPENIKKMLDEKNTGKHRIKISLAGRITVAVCACAMLTGVAVSSAKLLKNKQGSELSESIIDEDKTVITLSDEPYMKCAESYEQIYNMIKKAQKAWAASNEDGNGITNGAMNKFYEINSDKAEIAEDIAGADSGDGQFLGEIIPAPPPTEDTNNSEENGQEEQIEETTEELTEFDDYYKTHNQEEGVLEADIVKTDGERIYYVYNDFFEGNSEYTAVMNIAEVDNGKFTDTYTLDLTPLNYAEGDGRSGETYVNDIYLYNDMIAVLGTIYSTYDDDGQYDYKTETFVSFYTVGSQPELIGRYYQEGEFNDVRIAPDGYMYLITNDYSNFYDSMNGVDDIDGYIPECGIDEMKCIPPSNILLPKTLDNSADLSYTIIGSIDMTVRGEFSVSDTKALAGCNGTIYCSADNLYTVSAGNYNMNDGKKEYESVYTTDITRISISGGSIVPQAGGTVNGYINDSYSMSEYGGYFRVATSCTVYRDGVNEEDNIAYHKIIDEYNSLYVLDLDMNIVGAVEGFGKDETVKSVRFNGNSAFVVTYEQTDPLFAIDLSDPTAPFITDSFKIFGYSTYLEKWDDEHLLGFGVDADENGTVIGVKLVMFDNSDPYDLKEAGIYKFNSYDEYIWSEATSDSKALLIAPEKNLIGFPVESDSEQVSRYQFFSYEDGEFIFKGELSGDYDYPLNRAVYIGGYVYAVSGKCFVSADIETLTLNDIVYFR